MNIYGLGRGDNFNLVGVFLMFIIIFNKYAFMYLYDINEQSLPF